MSTQDVKDSEKCSPAPSHTLEIAKEAKEEDVTKKDDIAAQFLRDIALEDPSLLADWTPAEEKKMLRWRIDPILLTLCQFALMMGAVDKVCIGTAAVLGMTADLHLVGQQYSWVSSIIYFGAIVAVLPSLYIMQHIHTGKWIAFNCFMWGALLMVSATVHTWSQIMAIRFILGLFESVIFAGFGIIISMFWKQQEQPWRTAVIFSTLSSVVNGLLSYAASTYTGSLAKWRLLFLSVGAVTIFWSILTWLFLPDNPARAAWLSKRQKVIAIRRLADNRTGVQNKVFKLEQVAEAFMDPKTWFVFLTNIVLNIPNNGVLTFNSIIVATLGFTTQQTTLLAIPTGVISWISSIIFALLAVKTRQRFLMTAVAIIPPMIGTIVLLVVPRSNQSGSLAGLYILFMYWGPYTTLQTIMYAHTGGYTKRIVVYAVSYVGYCVGNLIGPQTFKADQAPKYRGGCAAMLSCYAVAMLLVALYYVYTRYLNSQKAKQLAAWEAEHGHEGILEEWHDQTDRQNPRFVYIY